MAKSKPRLFKRAKDKPPLIPKKPRKKKKNTSLSQEEVRGAEEVKRKQEFPNISRFIPEWFGRSLFNRGKLRTSSFGPLRTSSFGKLRRSLSKASRLFNPLITNIPQVSLSKLRKSRPKMVIFVGLVIVGVVWNIWMGIGLYKTILSWSQLWLQREKLTQEMQLWENITKQYPNYRDAYVEGAIYAYRLGDKGKEEYFLSNLKLLDPNFTITKSLEELQKLQDTQ